MSETVEIIRAIAKEQAEQAVMSLRMPTTYQTTNATPVIVLVIEVEQYNGGFYEIEVVGVEVTGTGKISGKQIIGFWKDTTLTLDTPSILHDEDGIGASWQAINDSENIAVELTGIVGTINWFIRVVNPLFTYATSVP